jgi:hypothetical protein
MHYTTIDPKKSKIRTHDHALLVDCHRAESPLTCGLAGAFADLMETIDSCDQVTWIIHSGNFLIIYHLETQNIAYV